MTQAHCEAWCAADDNCLALEMSGCHELQACRGSCYHYYTLDFDHAVSHNDPYYKEIGADKEVLKRFIKRESNVFVSMESHSNPLKSTTAARHSLRQTSSLSPPTSGTTTTFFADFFGFTPPP